MLSRITDPLISLLYPSFCGSCGAAVERAADGSACRACWESTRIFGSDDPLCEKCGLLLESVHVGASPACHNCADHSYDRAFAVGVYEKALAATVVQLKRQPHLPSTAGAHLRDAFDRMGESSDLLIVPVPLSRQRRLERGFNQAEVLAKVVSRHSGFKVDDRSLTRIRDTPMHRAAMDNKAREITVSNVFAITRPRLISGRNILLIDDLMTSGATVSRCAGVLKKNGAGKVVVLNLARAV